MMFHGTDRRLEHSSTSFGTNERKRDASFLIVLTSARDATSAERCTRVDHTLHLLFVHLKDVDRTIGGRCDQACQVPFENIQGSVSLEPPRSALVSILCCSKEGVTSLYFVVSRSVGLEIVAGCTS